MKTSEVKIGNVIIGGSNIGKDTTKNIDANPIIVQTMCNTHTYDVDETVTQCERLAKAGSQLIRITVPGLRDVEDMKKIKAKLRAKGITTPLVADIHFSSETGIAMASVVEKVRINPGNFHRNHKRAQEQFAKFLKVCKENNTAIRIGLNHGSLGEYITNLYGNTPNAMAKAAMEWINMCLDAHFYNVVVSLKASNTYVMVEAYRLLAKEMYEKGINFPFHVGVTEAGNGDTGRIKSCVGISSLLSEGIGDTIRVSLTEDPANELPVAQYLADRYRGKLASSISNIKIVPLENSTAENDKSSTQKESLKAIATYYAPSRERLLLDASCDFGKRLLDMELDEVEILGKYVDKEGKEVSIEESGLGKYLSDEIMQAARRRFYKPEYIACPGCGRTMYNLQDAFEEVKNKTAHLKDVVIAVMGCIVNGPGEMADADWGYVGEGNNKVSIYKKHTPILRHIPENEAVDKLIELIEAEQKKEK